MFLKICLILNYSRCLEGLVPLVNWPPPIISTPPFPMSRFQSFSLHPPPTPYQHPHTHLLTLPGLINMTTMTRYHMKKSQGTINFNFVKIWLNTHVFRLGSSCLKFDNLEMILGVTLKTYSNSVKDLVKDVKDLLVWSKELLCYTIKIYYHYHLTIKA